MGFQLVPKSVDLNESNGVMASILCYSTVSTNSAALGAN